MDPHDATAARQIGNRPRHAQYARIPAGRQTHHFCGLGKQPPPWLVGRCMFLKQLAIDFGIGARAVCAVAGTLDIAGGSNAGADFSTSFGGRRKDEIGGADRGDIDVEVDPVEHRAGDLGLIIGGTARRA